MNELFYDWKVNEIDNVVKILNVFNLFKLFKNYTYLQMNDQETQSCTKTPNQLT